MNFNELVGLPSVMRAIEQIGYENATEIQEKTIPLIKTGVDIIGKSQTGTGKTMAFAIPMVEMVDTTEEKRTVQALILCPTRELAMQVSEEIKKLTCFTDGIKTATVFGGSSMDRQIMKLKQANVVIGTPGRVMDHLRRKTLKLKNLKMIILDEADEMLSMGFKEDIQTILQDAPEERQTILFSATMPQAILDITREFQKDPQTIEVKRKTDDKANISQHYIDVPMGRKMDVLKLLLHMHMSSLSIIFANTKKMVDEIEENLTKSGFKALGIHGDMKQEQRTKVMNAYKNGSVNILVATDVAARGIDVDDVNFVINYDIPQNSEYYVHRIGRTGRAGKTGSAITIMSGRRQMFDLRDLMRDLKIKIEPMAIPNFEDIKEQNSIKNANAVEEALLKHIDEGYKAMALSLVERGHSLEDIAATALKMHFSKLDKALSNIAQIKANVKNDDFKRIYIDIGRNRRVAPNHLVGAITECSGISSKKIGKIEIFDAFSLVSIPKDDIDNVLSQMEGLTICGHKVKAKIDEKGGFSKPRSNDRRGDFRPNSGARRIGARPRNRNN